MQLPFRRSRQMPLQDAREHKQPSRTLKVKAVKGENNNQRGSTTGAGADATHQDAAAHEDTLATFRETAMRKAAAQLRSDAALASATPPIAWQEPRLGQKPLETDLPLPLHKNAKEEARA